LTEERKTTVGQYLRRERERQNKSLESVAQVTRITLNNLEALEEDNFQLFAAPVFVRGFLRTYATHLGLDPQEAISLYEAQVGNSVKPPSFTPPFPEERSRPLIRYLLPLVAIVFVIYIVSRVHESQKTPTQPSSSPPSSVMTPAAEKPFVAPPSEPPSAPTGAQEAEPPPKEEMAAKVPSAPKEPLKPLPEGPKPATPAAPAVAPASGEGKKVEVREHVLTIKASEVTWMRIQRGEPPVIDVILRPNETVTYKTKNSFDIEVGNAGGVELIFDGEAKGKPGKSGQVVHLILPPPASPPQQGSSDQPPSPVQKSSP